MKKYLALLLALVMSLSLFACGKKEGDDNKDKDKTKYKVAMITDYGDITDQSFNQTTYEACKAFAEDNSIEFSYFKPAGDNTADRVAMIEKAVDEGFNVIVMPGYAFGGAIVEAAPEFPDVKFIRSTSPPATCSRPPLPRPARATTTPPRIGTSASTLT